MSERFWLLRFKILCVRIFLITGYSMMNEMIFISAPQKRQSKGSISAQPIPAGKKGTSNIEQIESFANGMADFCHIFRTEASQRSLDEPPIVEGAKLIYKKIGLTTQSSSGPYADTERLGLINQVRGKRNNDRRWMVGVEKSL